MSTVMCFKMETLLLFRNTDYCNATSLLSVQVSVISLICESIWIYSISYICLPSNLPRSCLLSERTYGICLGLAFLTKHGNPLLLLSFLKKASRVSQRKPVWVKEITIRQASARHTAFVYGRRSFLLSKHFKY